MDAGAYTALDRDLLFWKDKVIFVMVGLPARGKSFIANKICNFIQWQGMKAKVFNVGMRRRQEVLEASGFSLDSADFFSRDNTEANAMREHAALAVLSDLLSWMKRGEGDIAVFDATNTTKDRRSVVLEHCLQEAPHANVVFLESICDDADVLRSNMRQKAMNSPDFDGIDLETALQSLAERISHYESVYETIVDDSLSYIKLINLQSKVICNRVRGSLAHSIASFLMSMHGGDRPICLIRAGCCDQARPSGGGDYDPPLDNTGTLFAEQIAPLIPKKAMCYTSLLRRAIETGLIVSTVEHPQPLSILNNLDSGTVKPGQGIVVQQELRNTSTQERFKHRFPGGESQWDVAKRLTPFIKELERHRSPVVIVSHLSTLQVLYGYFVGCSPAAFCELDVPLHCMIQLTPSQYGWTEHRKHLNTSTGAAFLEEIPPAHHQQCFYGAK